MIGIDFATHVYATHDPQEYSLRPGRLSPADLAAIAEIVRSESSTAHEPEPKRMRTEEPTE
jgi:hypothetical protein